MLTSGAVGFGALGKDGNDLQVPCWRWVGWDLDIVFGSDVLFQPSVGGS